MPEQGRVSDNAHCGADAHGCPACPHAVTGPGVSGSPNVFVNALPALRVGDPGIHAACCGPNTWEAVEGAPSVFMNGKKAHRKGDGTKHCGGDGELVVGSPNVFVGNQQPKEREIEKSWFKLRVVNHRGDPVPNLKVRVHLPTGPQELTTDGSGRIQVKDVDPGSVFVEFLATMPIERMYRG
ncbi:MAG: hypothetical protein KC635_14880 [Myxococcales bacterium]|nr:hypothetical protein [Myxococcales bacterium]MCB9731951.1 hypothetical protein [Deltaproteobacteria bacterium]